MYSSQSYIFIHSLNARLILLRTTLRVYFQTSPEIIAENSCFPHEVHMTKSLAYN